MVQILDNECLRSVLVDVLSVPKPFSAVPKRFSPSRSTAGAARVTGLEAQLAAAAAREAKLQATVDAKTARVRELEPQAARVDELKAQVRPASEEPPGVRYATWMSKWFER